MAVLILAIAALATGGPASNHIPTYLCQSDLPRVGGRNVGWLNLHVDGEFSPVSSEVFLRNELFEGEWEVNAQGPVILGQMKSFEFRLPLSDAAELPVKVSVALDGRKVGEAEYTAVQRDSVFVDGAYRDSATVVVDNKLVPNIAGRRHMTVRAIDRSGKPVGQADLTLPDWGWLDRGIAEASRGAERMRQERACGTGAYF